MARPTRTRSGADCAAALSLSNPPRSIRSSARPPRSGPSKVLRAAASAASAPSRRSWHPLPWPLPADLPDRLSIRLAVVRTGRTQDHPLELARTMSARMRGLMFRQKPVPLLFTFAWTDRHAIHSFFVSFPFDAIYLDEQGRVADVFHSVPSFSPPFSPRAPARYLLELPPLSARRLGVRPGDQLALYRRS